MSAVKPAPEKGGRSEGTWGEALAAEYLRQRGCRLAAHSYHCRFGEIDLIAWDGDVLCFVEVKTRSNTDMGLPREYVTPAKQRRLKRQHCTTCVRSSWTVRHASMWRRSMRTALIAGRTSA